MSSPTVLSKPKQIRSQLLLWFMAGLILLSVAATYYKTIILRDFLVINDLEEALEE